jgi:hypothetical protein
VPNEYLLYPTGGHGYGLQCTKDARVWPDAALKWLHKSACNEQDRRRINP